VDGIESSGCDRGRVRRYADDFVVLVSGTEEDAIAEKSALAEHLRLTTGLELSPEKTKITAVTDGFEFLGFHVVMRWDKRYGYFPRVEIPKAKVADLRHRIKQLTRIDTTWCGLGPKLREINPILRGWAAYYRYCARAGRIYTALDWYITSCFWRVGCGRSIAKLGCATLCVALDAVVVARSDGSGVTDPSSSMCLRGHRYAGSVSAG
jgi:Group II intron, maturase-specific domain/Reverse transcriptase (RNA-dependent DNA polymerase)